MSITPRPLRNKGNTHDRFNHLWLEADHLLAGITGSLWDHHIEPIIEALEAGAFDGPDVIMRKRRRLGYQVVDADGEMPDGWVSFGIYKLTDCRRAINENKTRWKLVIIFEGDIEEPTFM
jgi:hypothetical protein